MESNKFVFIVKSNVNKVELKHFFRNQFSLNCISVNTSNVKGKKRRRGRIVGSTSDYKKAIVEFDDNDDLSVFNDLIKG